MNVGSPSFTGEIATFGFDYAPAGWAHCNGDEHPIAQDDVLFTLIGTIYGGDGRTTFRVPNFNSRMPIGAWRDLAPPDLEAFWIGERVGDDYQRLLTRHLPAHSHAAHFEPGPMPHFSVDAHTYDDGADKRQAAEGDLLAASFRSRYRSPGGFGEPNKVKTGGFDAKGADLREAKVELDKTGGGFAIGTRTPSIAVNFCICVWGDFPSRR